MITIEFTGRLIILCWIAMILFWLFSALFVKRTLERQSWKWPRIILCLVIVTTVILSQHGYTGPVLVSRTLAIAIAADAMAFLGALIEIWARMYLGRNWSADLTLKENHELIDRGPYRFIRHPIYTGFALLILGTTLWYGHAEGFIFFIALLAGLYIRAQREERLLSKQFPSTYLSYKAKTKMFIPFVF